MDIVNEGSNWLTEVFFVDDENQPVVPQAVQYRIDDVGSLAEIRPLEEVALPIEVQTSLKIKWDSSDTIIVDESNPFELRRMTVTWQYTDSDDEPQGGSAQYLLQVRNLQGVQSPEFTT
jgi:hypothetical protein